MIQQYKYLGDRFSYTLYDNNIIFENTYIHIMVYSLLFAYNYIKCLNAFTAASAIGLNFTKKPSRYYVYFLLHPGSGKIIYVGKGKGNRKDAHLRDYYNLQICNARKHNTIGKIVREGLEPLSVIFKNNLEEAEAFELEAFFINYFMDYGISNSTRGEKMSLEQSQEIAKHLLSRIMNFDKWCSLEPRTEIQKEFYWLIKKGLEDMAVVGNIAHIIQVTNEKGISIHYEYC